MFFTVEELSRKDVINVKDGCRIGFVRDVELDESGRAAAVTVERASPRGSPFRKAELLKVRWEDIVVIGKETVLVKDAEEVPSAPQKKGRLSDLFS